ncbi:MAG: hypothetical protein ABS76_26455 [Pelagibacterium sp. SCN 64-44]|nr:MAG: hypothetical protein ABS76_26455 [Pelagibacterium sp. SCN 64-44]
MADIIKPDLCVIGAGALGLSLARRASARGLDVVLVARPGPEPGDAPQGRLRRAALMASAARAQALRRAGALGLDKAEPKLNFRAVAAHAAAMAKAGASRDTPERLAALGVRLIEGEGEFVAPGRFALGQTIIRARHFALAMGSEAVVPPLPELDKVAFFTPDSIVGNIRKLTHLLVIGGTPEAFELAQAYRRLGAQVSLVPQGGLLPGFAPEPVALLLRALREEGLDILEDAEVSAIQPRRQGIGIALTRADGPASLDVSHILVAMGRQRHGPDGTDRRVTRLEDEPHIAERQAALLVERLAGHGPGRLSPDALPRFVLTEPTLAQAGRIEPLRPGETLWRANLAENDAARAMGEAQGLLALASGKGGRILGGAAVGPGAVQTIALLALCMEKGLSLSAVERLALPPVDLAAALIDIAGQYGARRPRRRLWW